MMPGLAGIVAMRREQAIPDCDICRERYGAGHTAIRSPGHGGFAAIECRTVATDSTLSCRHRT